MPASALTAAKRARREYQRAYMARRRAAEPAIREKNRNYKRERYAELTAEEKLSANQKNYADKLRRDPLYNAKRRAKVYGVTYSHIQSILERQGGGCAICGSREELRIDHCHKTGAVRGVLCQSHNTGLGLLGDDAEGLTRALRYLLQVSHE